MADLGKFEGKAVRQSSITIPNVSGGLNEGMKIEPQMIKQGERRWAVMELVCRDVDFKPIDASDPAGDQKRQHVMIAEVVTFVDQDLVAEQIEKQKARIALAADAARG